MLYSLLSISQFIHFPTEEYHDCFQLLAIMNNVKVKLLSNIQLFVTSWTITFPAPLSMDFSRPEYWSGPLSPSPRDLLNPGIKPRSPTLQTTKEAQDYWSG